MTIHVKQLADGWQITKDGKSMTVKDNGDGKFGNGDEITSSSGSLFTAAEKQAVADKLNNISGSKNTNFGAKVGGFFGGLFSGMMGLGLGPTQDIWSRNIGGGIGFNDIQVGLFNAMPGILGAGVKGMIPGGIGGVSSGAVNLGSLSSMITAAHASLIQQQDALEAMVERSTERASQQRVDNQFNAAKILLEDFEKNPDKITESNLEKFKAGFEYAEENDKIFDENDIPIMKKINTAPLINEELIADSTDDDSKIPMEKAVKLNKLLEKYKKAEDDKKADIISDAEHTKLQALLNTNEVDADDLEFIDTLIQ